MKKPTSIHFVGIKGVGMAPLAIIAKEAGIIVTGSDIADGFITDSILQHAGITPCVGFDPSHVGNVDLVITTGAHHGYDNVEVMEAKKRGIPFLTQGQAVGEFMKGDILGSSYKGISVTGTHGKTTTTAMIASIFHNASYDPSWVIGTSFVPSLGAAGHFGEGGYFIAEADEYATEPVYDKTSKFLWQHPQIAVFTNIEHDHPDVYPTLDSVREAFLTFAYALPKNGFLVAYGDDPQMQKLLKEYSGNRITYGCEAYNMYIISNIKKSSQGVTWDVVHKEKKETLSIPLYGEHNMLNATAAYIVANLCVIPIPMIQKGLSEFRGTKRRMEYIGQTQSGALVYDDYAHHPTEIQKTLKALREKYPNNYLVCLFQPHTFSRTKLLFDEFLSSFTAVDEVVFAEIYPSQREVNDLTISSQMLTERLLKQGQKAAFASNLADVVKYIHDSHYGKDTVLITMGAGDIYTIAQEILEHESALHSSY